MKILRLNKQTADLLFTATKISFGCAVATIISTLLNLDFSATAGLIAVLSIQDTKKETAQIAVKRLISFCAAIAISFVCFRSIGYTTIAFAVYLFVFIIFCRVFKAQSAIVPVSVLITHILSFQDFTLEIIFNELMLLIVGVATGFVLNLYMRKDSAKMKKTKSALDNEIKGILERMSARILISDKSDYDHECFLRLKGYLDEARNTAVRNESNTLGGFDRYDFLYLDMREKQCTILYEMYKIVKDMDASQRQGEIISEFLKKIAEEYHEMNDVKGLTAQADKIIEDMKNQDMPQSRTEFENRALLYTLLIRTKEFLTIKYMFMEKKDSSRIGFYM